MAPRPRSMRKRDLPDNLYEDDGYFSWRDPRTGKKYGIGRDKKAAVRQANEANFAINSELAQARLVDRLTGDIDRTFENFKPIYTAELEKRNLSNKTLTEKKQQLNVVSKKFGNSIMSRVTTLEISAFIDAFLEKDNDRTAQVYRSLLLDYFREAQAKGWVESNPVTVTKAPKVEVKRSRLVLSDFRAIYTEAIRLEPWVSNSMLLALVTGQRREDIAAAKFADAKDGFLWIDQGKTGAKVKIPLKLRLASMDWSVEEVIKQCRGMVLSPYIIHNTKKHAKAKPGDPLHTSSLSAGFAKAREMAAMSQCLKWEGTPPSFHELRSLSERLYNDQGIDTQVLLGHKDARMTAVYHDSRGAEWLEVKC